jgi:ribosomal protein S18 acetylase RimI-like enzyme
MPGETPGLAPRIRPVREEDVGPLVRLTLEAFVPVFEMFERELGPAVFRLIWPDWGTSQQKAVERFCRDREGYAVWVAEVDGVPAGLIACTVNDDDHTGVVQFLAVGPEHQRRGIGTALNGYALERMRERGVRLASVETGADPAHAPARRSYEKSGFVAMPLVRYFKDL